ncbi:MAG TPA: FtsW/RodA/SpoVE family cell cycle protein, partial [Solirubrobacteraceae bacterium]|nr:FtsW/RodA/SpoVE family cell cycle protein [Solirubrobacteraceae bacterium]
MIDAPKPSPSLRAALRLPFDPLLALAVVGLGACSLVAVQAASPDELGTYYVVRQAAYFVLGLVLAAAVSRVDYSRLRELKYGLYALLMLSIVAVLIFGSVSRGARLSIEFPFFSFQASELGKVLLVVVLAAFLTDRSRRLDDRDTTARTMLLALIPAAVVMIAPDLGSATVYMVVAVALLFLVGTSWKHFAALGALMATAVALVLVAAPAVGVPVLEDYQEERLTAFLEPSADPADAGYQQAQSQVAIGSGQRIGRGEQATQTRLDFLPEARTDFIFAGGGAGWGCVGAGLG